MMRRLVSWFRKKFKRKVSPREELQRRKLTEQEYWARCLEDVRDGRRADPLLMTDTERHYATRAITAQFQWSKDFVYRMRTPLWRQLQETGKAVNLIGGDDFATPEVYTTQEELVALSQKKQWQLESHVKPEERDYWLTPQPAFQDNPEEPL